MSKSRPIAHTDPPTVFKIPKALLKLKLAQKYSSPNPSPASNRRRKPIPFKNTPASLRASKENICAGSKKVGRSLQSKDAMYTKRRESSPLV